MSGLINELIEEHSNKIKNVSQAKEIDEVGTLAPAELEAVEIPDDFIVGSTPKGPNEFIKLAQAEKQMDFCKHDQVKGFCKKGCK